MCMRILFADLRFAARMLAKRPGFTGVAVLALALGIGANTAVFSVIRGVVLRPLPYRDPDRLVAIWESNLKANAPREPSSPPNLHDWSDQNRCFTAMAGYTLGSSPFTDSGDAEMLDAGYVTANYFELLGVKPALGRAIASSDAEKEVVLLSAELWDRRFGRGPNISALRAELQAMDPTRPPYAVRTEEDLIAANIAPRRFALTLIGLFAGLAQARVTAGPDRNRHRSSRRAGRDASDGDLFIQRFGYRPRHFYSGGRYLRYRRAGGMPDTGAACDERRSDGGPSL